MVTVLVCQERIYILGNKNMKRAGGEMQTINKIHSMTSEVKIVFL
jgi:hypothetical protein